MRVAIATDVDDPEAEVSYFGGRAPHYLIFDEDGNLIDSIRNPFADRDRHVGHELSLLLIEERVDAVLAGLFGPAMLENLSNSGIACVVKRGRARQALKEYLLLSRR